MSLKYLCGTCLNYSDYYLVFIDDIVICPICGRHEDEYMEEDEYAV